MHQVAVVQTVADDDAEFIGGFMVDVDRADQREDDGAVLGDPGRPIHVVLLEDLHPDEIAGR